MTARSVVFLPVVCAGAVLLDRWCEKNFPPDPVPELPPRPGYLIHGYMGCPRSSVEAIRRQERLLFFSKTVDVPQQYALGRTAFRGQPVVLQIETRGAIRDDELWHDREPTSVRPIQMTLPLSLHPAIPPEVQKKYDLQVRVHHVVNCSLRQQGGGLCRGVNRFLTYLWG
jgi:hypothetical protein